MKEYKNPNYKQNTCNKCTKLKTGTKILSKSNKPLNLIQTICQNKQNFIHLVHQYYKKKKINGVVSK